MVNLATRAIANNGPGITEWQFCQPGNFLLRRGVGSLVGDWHDFVDARELVQAGFSALDLGDGQVSALFDVHAGVDTKCFLGGPSGGLSCIVTGQH